MAKQHISKNFALNPGDDGTVWELFHENSKLRKHGLHLSEEEVLVRMGELDDSLPFDGYPEVKLPNRMPKVTLPFEEVLQTRSSVRNLRASDLTLPEISAMLYYSYGVSRPLHNNFPRPFRIVPSAGALYPLEIFFFTEHSKDLKTGIYHYNPREHHLRLFREGNYGQPIAEGLVQHHLVSQASLIVFITALFERTVFKYDDRGYRFAFLEAGHLAQNLNLVSNGLGWACINIGGYYDRHIDHLLDLDGLNQSTIYMMAIGKSSST